ncbi:MAG: LPS translocon maturation chaperone LptM [Gammaproteobacteria bacterium]
MKFLRFLQRMGIAFILLSSLCLSSCGQSGPLYLPPENLKAESP